MSEVEGVLMGPPIKRGKCTGGVAALVLAAGYSRRYGSDKRTALVGGGTTLLNASLRPYIACFDEVWLVLRPDDPPSEMGLTSDVRVVQDSSTMHGMGHSISVGVRELIQHSEASSVAIGLGDMPYVKQCTLVSLAAHAKPSRIVVPRHTNRRGHPVIFGRNFWTYLYGLNGDRGAKIVMDSFPASVDLLDVDDLGVLLDVDTAADLTAHSPR